MKEHTKNLYAWAHALAAIALALLIINQVQILGVRAAMHGEMSDDTMITTKTQTVQELSGVDVQSIQSTAQGLSAVMQLEGKTSQDVVREMVPTGMPAYGEAMGGITFDDPVKSLQTLARAYQPLKAQIQQESPETYQRWLDLASSPMGISCEYCCSIGAYAITKEGRDMCGCQHHPALQTVALWLMDNTDYNDAEVLREVYKWKTLFFPKDMVALGTRIAGGDDTVYELPQMVGGC